MTAIAETAAKISGAVMVIGGGVAGVQTALDLTELGYKVYLVEKSAAIGGVMARLDKTFPTNDCSLCILAPKLVEAGRDPNIEILTLSELVEPASGPVRAGNTCRRLLSFPDSLCGLPAFPLSSDGHKPSAICFKIRCIPQSCSAAQRLILPSGRKRDV